MRNSTGLELSDVTKQYISLQTLGSDSASSIKNYLSSPSTELIRTESSAAVTGSELHQYFLWIEVMVVKAMKETRP